MYIDRYFHSFPLEKRSSLCSETPLELSLIDSGPESIMELSIDITLWVYKLRYNGSNHLHV